MQLPKVRSLKVHMMLNDPKFKELMNQKVTIDRTYDVPYLAGYSKDGKTIYIDRHFPITMGKKNIEKYIISHEHIEKSLIMVFGLNYQKAHHIAMSVEHDTVVNDGIDYAAYNKYCNKYIKHIGHEKIQKPPKDLDLEPYKDEHDLKELAQLKAKMK